MSSRSEPKSAKKMVSRETIFSAYYLSSFLVEVLELLNKVVFVEGRIF